MFIKKSNYEKLVQDKYKAQLNNLKYKRQIEALEQELIQTDEIWTNNDKAFDKALNTVQWLEDQRRADVLEKRKLRRDYYRLRKLLLINDPVQEDLPIDKTILFRKFTEMPDRDNSILFRKFDAPEKTAITGCHECPKHKYKIRCQTTKHNHWCPHDGLKQCCGRDGKFPAHVEFKINGRS